MKGAPVREVLSVLLLAALLLIPMRQLASPDAVSKKDNDSEIPERENADSIPTWLNLRCSHAATSLVLKQEDQVLLSHEGEIQGVSLETELPRDGVMITLEVFWPVDTEGSPFAQLTLEPDGQKEKIIHMWGKPGYQRKSWFVDPEQNG